MRDLQQEVEQAERLLQARRDLLAFDLECERLQPEAAERQAQHREARVQRQLATLTARLDEMMAERDQWRLLAQALSQPGVESVPFTLVRGGKKKGGVA